jgi:NADH dehydrogenase/NADH:ubiquinone oxidoreductase subunit G
MSTFLSIDRYRVSVPEHTTLLAAAEAAHVLVPTLCRN